jgi:hypothetical protein
MTVEQMRELAAKKAEEWIIPDERLLAAIKDARRVAGIAQNYTAREIGAAIRALPLEADK